MGHIRQNPGGQEIHNEFNVAVVRRKLQNPKSPARSVFILLNIAQFQLRCKKTNCGKCVLIIVGKYTYVNVVVVFISQITCVGLKYQKKTG